MTGMSGCPYFAIRQGIAKRSSADLLGYVLFSENDDQIDDDGDIEQEEREPQGVGLLTIS